MSEDNTTATPSMSPVDSSVASVSEPTASEPATTSDAAATSDVVVKPMSSDAVKSVNVAAESSTKDTIYSEVAGKIREAKNVLIALSSDPSVDEMAAAIGLSLFLDKLGKRATAIYSGSTPNALEFLKPEETFESTADTLQDFVIALNKDKADHLRYKLDGDYVKIYITPYKTRIAEEDLEFSYGDFNVDLVLALDVANGIDLDSALREHGRIMHDAVIINITTGNPGKFGEIEWSDKSASSVSEMIAKLLYNVAGEKVGKEEATAFLTGIVAATNRFSNGSTTSETMQIASKLMKSGANQQLISKNITPDVENEMFSLSTAGSGRKRDDSTDLEITHEAGDGKTESEPSVEEATTDKSSDVSEESGESVEKDDSLMEDLKAAAASLAQTGVDATPEADKVALKIDGDVLSQAEEVASVSSEPAVVSSEPVVASESAVVSSEPVVASDSVTSSGLMASSEPVVPVEATEEQHVEQTQEKVLQPSEDFSSPLPENDEDKYGKMLEDALKEANVANTADTMVGDVNDMNGQATNPAAANAPMVVAAPEINGVPEMNYMPEGGEILPPPPTPPVDMSNVSMPTTVPEVPSPVASAAMPSVAPVVSVEPAVGSTPEPITPQLQPVAQASAYGAQPSDPGAFRIPGM